MILFSNASYATAPLWGGVRGGGRCYCAQNVLEHAVDIGQHVVVPIAQHAIAIRLQDLCALLVGSRSSSVLTSVDLNDDTHLCDAKSAM
jgi:hypothetical protein